MLKVKLLPFDKGVLVRTDLDVSITILDQRTQEPVLVGIAPQYKSTSYLEYQEYAFISERDGTYEVTAGEESKVIVVNNNTLLLLEHVRSSILRKENTYTIQDYELLLSLNYTALDNWRIGDYEATHRLFDALADYTTLRDVKINQLTDY